MRLIDAEEIGLTDFEIAMCGGSSRTALEMLIDKILNAPTVDAVQVVRCKDCKYYLPFANVAICKRHGITITLTVTETDYCSMGERKEEQ